MDAPRYRLQIHSAGAVTCSLDTSEGVRVASDGGEESETKMPKID